MKTATTKTQSLTWTTTPPITVGWYWWRATKTQDMGVRYIEDVSYAARVTMVGGLEWAGPIAEPGERG